MSTERKLKLASVNSVHIKSRYDIPSEIAIMRRVVESTGCLADALTSIDCDSKASAYSVELKAGAPAWLAEIIGKIIHDALMVEGGGHNGVYFHEASAPRRELHYIECEWAGDYDDLA